MLLAMNLMVFSWFFYSRELGGAPAIGAEYAVLVRLFAALQMFLCTGIVALLGVPLASDALARLLTPRRGSTGLRSLLDRIDVELLIVIGVGAAFTLSLLHTVSGDGPLYYDTTAMVLVVVGVGRFLEAGAKRAVVRSAEALLPGLPDRVTVWRDARRTELGVAEVVRGDRVEVRAGEAIAVDGIVEQGRSQVDEASLSGESMPRRVAPGERVLAGSINLSGLLVVEAQRVGEARAMMRMRELLDGARLRQPEIQRVADRVASWFVPGVVVLALAVFAWHGRSGDFEAGLFSALSVVLISCPCALGLAAPLASWHALRSALDRGIVFESSASLERAARISRVVFDKTGTLTDPEVEMDRLVVVAGASPRQALSWAAALETTSMHPLARCLLGAAERSGIELPVVEDARVIPGIGVEGVIEGRRLRLGGPELARDGDERDEDDEEDTGAAIRLCLCEADGTVLARLRFTERLRADAEPTIARLRRMGVEVTVLTGDRAAPAERIAARLGVETHSRLLPEDKVTKLEEIRARGRGGVAAVGDGLNDAPLLAASDLGITLGSATDLAQQSGQVHIVGDQLTRVAEVLEISRRAVRRIRVNLGFSFGYNLLALPLAASGRLSPVIAALAMACSSLTVIALSRAAGQPFATADAGAPPSALTADSDTAATRTAALERLPQGDLA